ncbi:hypothetical protein C0Q70_11670 [Pomacea canaliculata]|uniref:Pre-mRNA-splicing regulator WTAP n=1 Tax=Pomacea canaliculata TaxID=400727 RepID=A0A2T7P6Q1_POMCA|nr:hypothetical protein C0Q70_11670 [Pomacea canaliculata]
MNKARFLKFLVPDSKMSEGPPSPKKLRLDLEERNSLSRDELIEKLREQDDYIAYLQARQRGRSSDKDESDDKDVDDKLKQQPTESSRRENTLVLRLTNKEQELQDCMNQITEMKAAQTQNSAQLRSLLLDPAVNLVFQRMAKEMEDCKEKLKQTQNELSAWKFTPDSQMGKRLMAKCRMLLQENEELGKMISSGRTAKLESEIALQKTMVAEMKNSQDEMTEFVGELEEDVEGMQSMIYVLQQQLKETKEQLANLEAENARLRTLIASTTQPEPGGCGETRLSRETPGETGAPPATGKQQTTIISVDSSNKVQATDVHSSQSCSDSSQTAADGLGKWTTSNGEDLEKSLKANGRTSDVMENSRHQCALTATETPELRTDQACEVAQSMPVTKLRSDRSLDSVGKSEADSRLTEDSLDQKPCIQDLKPVRNGGLDVVDAKECEEV